jgi:hypothetical protein
VSTFASSTSSGDVGIHGGISIFLGPLIFFLIAAAVNENRDGFFTNTGFGVEADDDEVGDNKDDDGDFTDGGVDGGEDRGVDEVNTDTDTGDGNGDIDIFDDVDKDEDGEDNDVGEGNGDDEERGDDDGLLSFESLPIILVLVLLLLHDESIIMGVTIIVGSDDDEVDVGHPLEITIISLSSVSLILALLVVLLV